MNDNTSNINNNQAFTEEQSGMTKATVIMWITRFLKRWYLFVISIAVFMTLAYLKNRSWQPFYKSNAMMIIQSGRGYSYGQNQLLGGFSLERAFSDVNNQITAKQAEVDAKQVEINEKQADIDQRWSDFKLRMKAMQRLNDGGSIALLSSATNLYELLSFQQTLEAEHISATVRREMGADIGGACGQLRRSRLHAQI